MPPAPQPDAAAAERQKQAFIEALEPRRPGRPVIALAALNEGTEITDFLLPHAVLQRSGVADVQPVAPQAGRVSLYPAAFRVEGVQDFASFDRAHPNGADYVIVPAMAEPEDPAITSWLKQQFARGARIISVCAGARVVASAGLLDGRRFATHWFYREDVLEREPSAVYVPHQRYVIDRGVATTTGITASVPTMLALVEAIGGFDEARALATQLGVEAWTPVHDSTRFGLDARSRFDYVVNKLAFWRHERWQAVLHEGMDDVRLAFATDAWARTGRVQVDAAAEGPVKLQSGVVIAAKPAADELPRLPLSAAGPPMSQLDRTLCEIQSRFGAARREWVAMELEYAGGANACAR